MGFTVFLILFVLMGSVGAADDNITASSQDTYDEIDPGDILAGSDDSGLNEQILEANHENTSLKTSVSGDTFADIQTAIDSAGDGDTIELDGLYKGSGTAITIDKNNLTLIGNDATLDGRGQSRILSITGTGVILKNIKFINGNSTDNGGAICWYGADGRIDNCSFTGNTATQRGGAIYWCAVNGTVNNSNFTNNTAAKFSGGAIQWDGNFSNGRVNNCSFTNNIGTQKGGAVYWYGVNGMISNSRFINNTSYNGGAIFWDSNSLDGVVNNCSFIKNDGGDGGAIYWFGAKGKMTFCNFTNNTGTNGGAINWQRTYGLVNNCNFINNMATNGGAVYWEGTNGTANSCNFTGNAADNGGAICWYGYNGTVNNSKFTDNRATQNGGAIAITGDVAKIDNVKLINSTAAGSGGAIYVGAKGSVISNSELSANSAADGTDNIAIGLNAEASLTDNVTADKGPVISFVTEINATCAGDVYQGGNPIAINIKTNAKKGTVSITVKGKAYKATVKDGVATITISDLAAGTYNDVAVGYHDSTGDYGDAGDNVTFTVKASEAKIISKDIKKDYNSNYKYAIRIIGVDGKPVNGAKIKISINGKAKTYKTNSKGYITIKLDKTYTPGKYTVKLSYKGITSKHVITVKQILKAKKVVKVKKSAKKIVLKATLKSGNGKAIKGKKITFKVKGKTYRAKTNKKGVAEITLKNKVIKKLKAGRTYTVKITYLKDTIKTKLKVKK